MGEDITEKQRDLYRKVYARRGVCLHLDVVDDFARCHRVCRTCGSWIDFEALRQTGRRT